MKHQIFYYSATGNSLSVSRKLAAQTGGADIINIADISAPNWKGAGTGTAGIVFPVFYWGIPLGVAKFINETDWSGFEYIYAVATFGGLAGLALEQVEQLLEAKGASLSAGYLVQMPGNYIVNYGAFPEWLQAYIFRKMERKLPIIAGNITEHRKQPFERSKTVIDRAMSPRFYAKAKDFPLYDRNFRLTEACNGCGTCVRACHFNNIELQNKKPVWQHKCEHCMACLQLCPKEAIQYGDRTENRKRYKNPEIKLSELLKD